MLPDIGGAQCCRAVVGSIMSIGIHQHVAGVHTGGGGGGGARPGISPPKYFHNQISTVIQNSNSSK